MKDDIEIILKVKFMGKTYTETGKVNYGLKSFSLIDYTYNQFFGQVVFMMSEIYDKLKTRWKNESVYKSNRRNDRSCGTNTLRNRFFTKR